MAAVRGVCSWLDREKLAVDVLWTTIESYCLEMARVVRYKLATSRWRSFGTNNLAWPPNSIPSNPLPPGSSSPYKLYSTWADGTTYPTTVTYFTLRIPRRVSGDCCIVRVLYRECVYRGQAYHKQQRHDMSQLSPFLRWPGSETNTM